MIKHPTNKGHKESNIFYDSDYYVEFFDIGKVYRTFTDNILKCGIELDNIYDINRDDKLKRILWTK